MRKRLNRKGKIAIVCNVVAIVLMLIGFGAWYGAIIKEIMRCFICS